MSKKKRSKKSHKQPPKTAPKTSKRSVKKASEQTPAMRVLGIVGISLFFLSFLSYFLLMHAGFQGTQNGLSGGPVVYGWEAIKTVFISYCTVPLYPVCMLYELLFAVLYIRKQGKTLKVVALAVTLVTLVGLIVPCVNHAMKKSIQLEGKRPYIEQYLYGKYGIPAEKVLSVDTSDYLSYKVETSVLPGGEFFVFTDFSGELADDSFLSQFMLMNEGFREDFTGYLKDLYDVPSDTDLSVNILAMNLEEYNAGDSYTELFPGVAYEVSTITVETDDASDEALQDILREVCYGFAPELRAMYAYSITVEVTSEGEPQYRAYITPDYPAEDNVNNLPYVVIEVYAGAEVDSALNGESFYLEASREP